MLFSSYLHLESWKILWDNFRMSYAIDAALALRCQRCNIIFIISIREENESVGLMKKIILLFSFSEKRVGRARYPTLQLGVALTLILRSLKSLLRERRHTNQEVCLYVGE